MHFHWLAILVAAVAGFAVGGVWYGPLFGKAWMNARGIAKEDTAGMNMPLIFGTTYVLNVIMAFALVQIVVHMIYFLHMNTKAENGWTVMALIFTVVIVVITLSGSLWVMYHLNHNMMPMSASEMGQLP